MTEEVFIQFIGLPVILLIAVAYDLLYQRIPNWLTFTAMVLAPAYYAASGGWHGFLFSIGGIFLGIALFIFPYLLGGMGAGDAKLMGAVGGLLGAKGVFVAFLLTALVGGVYAMIVLIIHSRLRETLRRYWLMMNTFFIGRKIIYMPPSEQEKKPRLRYGVAIALGTITTVIMKNNIYEMLNLN